MIAHPGKDNNEQIRTDEDTGATTSPASQRVSRHRRRLRRFACAALVVSLLLAATALLLNWAFPFPQERLERWPDSPLVVDRHGRPLLGIVSRRDEWREAVPLERMSPWLLQAAVAVEDERFWHHPGVDPLAVARAAGQNLYAGRVVSGASTLTMQVCRMMDDRPRTWSAKMVESFRAMQLEWRRDKRGILETYLNLIPCGGNLRGVEAAAQAYFGKRAADLSLEEAALVVGLAQAPSRYRPDRHPEAAITRRAVVLARMYDLHLINAAQLAAANERPLQVASNHSDPAGRHVAWLALERRPQGGRTTIDRDLQHRVESLAVEHGSGLPSRSQAAVVVIDIASGDFLALVGSTSYENPIDGQVNGATARRSPGSALKPFVYAAAFEAGRLAPDTLVYDVPIQRAGWSPENFDHLYRGPITAADALRRSLNVPAILVAEGVGLRRCLGVMEAAGLRLPGTAGRRAGLGAVVGTVEVSLLDLTAAYAALGRGGLHIVPRLYMDEPSAASRILSDDCCAAVNDVLSTRHRRPRGLEAVSSENLPWFMWKTGTSSGRRDAWAIGHNTRYAVGVWVGRFNGLGNARFVGAEAAEPLLAALLTLPEFRTTDQPPPPPVLVARRPLPPPKEYADWAGVAGRPGSRRPLEVLEPREGAVFIAVGGEIVIAPRATAQDGLAWFLNGRHLPPVETTRLHLCPGAYELRCVDEGGQAAATRFRVRGA